jgi:hypothetical protein
MGKLEKVGWHFEPRAIGRREPADESITARGNSMDESLKESLQTALSELGKSGPANIIQTMLLKYRFFVGWKFRYDGGYAILHAKNGSLEVFDEQGALLRTVAVAASKNEAA